MPEPDMSVWTGRVDEADGPRALRWHQRVKPFSAGCEPGVVLIGFACDEGVRRNGGRVGAKDGPRAIRAALANLAWHHVGPVYDMGDVCCDDEDMEAAQSRLAEAVREATTTGHRPVVFGGGHEAAWGTFQGVVASHPDTRIGVINLDAHFDLRADHPGNSGTSFYQIASWCEANGRPFHYLCAGIAEPANTLALFERARDLGARWFRDADLQPWNLDNLIEGLVEFGQQVDVLFLSIDLDVLPGAVMPAVSAPAARGVALEIILPVVASIVRGFKVAAVDLVEFNPHLDPDGTAARVAARIAWQAAELQASPGD